ncbi:MAG: D-alanyl-D-alanine carboxypeptidase [Lachnospiraceae bacterium]|nr:D-alanyl-D-alanine carboxypeptidase [Lachnospiraceae bacterium]
MKCTNKKNIGLLLSLCILLFSGCAKEQEEVSFSNAYDIYGTSSEYQLITNTDTSLQDTVSFFASDLCVSDGNDIGTESTSSQVAKASGVFNLDTKEVTYAQNIYQRIYPASTTKILTAYVALKHGNLEDIYTVSENATNQASDSSICHLKTGDNLTLRQLLYGLMMRSGNDAAIAIAEGVSGSVEEFINLMNQEAAALGAVHSHFVNPNGLHDEEHYTTVYDLYLMFQAAIENETFMELIQTTTYTAAYTDAAGMPVEQTWIPTNRYLLGAETIPTGITVLGGKTGTTNAAGYCLVLLSQNASNQPIVSIVMKADCRSNLYYYMNELLFGFTNNS